MTIPYRIRTVNWVSSCSESCTDSCDTQAIISILLVFPVGIRSHFFKHVYLLVRMVFLFRHNPASVLRLLKPIYELITNWYGGWLFNRNQQKPEWLSQSQFELKWKIGIEIAKNTSNSWWPTSNDYPNFSAILTAVQKYDQFVDKFEEKNFKWFIFIKARKLFKFI